jgi:hypothetical protein
MSLKPKLAHNAELKEIFSSFHLANEIMFIILACQLVE